MSTRKFKILNILGQKPDFTGSGILVRELWKCGVKSIDEHRLICGGYIHDNWTDVFGSAHQVVTFTVKQNRGKLPFLIAGMSDVMPYPSVPYGELSRVEVSKIVEVYEKYVLKLVDEFKPDIVHIHHLWILTKLVHKLCDIPVIVTVHGSDLKLAKTAAQHIETVRNNISRINHVICVSRDIAEDTKREYDIHPRKISVIGNGYNETLFSFNGPSHQVSGKVVLCVGKFVEWKGFLYAIRACAQIPFNIKLVILGSGNKKSHDELISEASNCGIDLVLSGHVSQTEVALWMRRADTYILPSLHEPFGMSLLEALACGCRVVASGSGGPKDIIAQKLIDMGLATLIKPLKLTDANDKDRYVKDFADAIHSQILLKTSESDRLIISKSVEHMTWSAKYDQIRSIYKRLRDYSEHTK